MSPGNKGYGRTDKRKFSGDSFTWDSKHKTKAKAHARARRLRGLGGKARVIKQTKFWVVYKRRT